MDRRLKERLVGATILVVLVVLIVPELLSGPKHPAVIQQTAVATSPLHSYEVNLATSTTTAEDMSAAAPSSTAEDGQSAPPPPVVTEEVNTEAPPPASPPAPPTVTTLHAQQPSATPLENSPPPQSTATLPDASHHAWTVQLGSFAKRDYAEALQRGLKAKGYPAFISASGAGRTLRYRVRVGPLADRGTAEREMVRLRKEGHAGSVVAP